MRYMIRMTWLTLWSRIAMFSLKRIGYNGIMPIEVDGVTINVLVPTDVSEWVPQGEEAHDCGCMGEKNEAS
jgi:hypothetical protein